MATKVPITNPAWDNTSLSPQTGYREYTCEQCESPMWSSKTADSFLIRCGDCLLITNYKR